ncbi:MAG: class I SAM-dependent methyltransferase [Candidatus Pacebacteria bacterium]|nr:class I SAM-dependent methyltransferase [Candidatus Paceibacterota bacterium]
MKENKRAISSSRQAPLRHDICSDEIREWVRKIHSFRLSFVERTAYGKFLDYGCGTGYVAKALQGRVEYTGVDVDPEIVAEAQSVYGTYGHFEVIRDNKLPYSDGTFDSAASLEVIEHLPKDKHAGFIDEITRVLKPGAPLVISTPNRIYPVKVFKKRFLRWHNPYHLYEYRPHEFLSFLASKGLVICDIQYMGDPLNLFGNPVGRLALNVLPAEVRSRLLRAGLRAGRLCPAWCYDILATTRTPPSTGHEQCIKRMQ